MTIERLFQDNNGDVESLRGLGLESFKYLYNNQSEKENISLLWFKTDRDTWLRIFIDDKNCIIDECTYDESSSDLKENLTCVEYNHWVDSSTIISAQVSLTDLQEITLTINLSNNNCIVFTCDASGNGSLKFLKMKPK